MTTAHLIAMCASGPVLLAGVLAGWIADLVAPLQVWRALRADGALDG